jgi:DNA invertase Pin-like site-specific DNA recombinase
MATERLAAIYARVSTEEQAKTSGVPSTETQVDACTDKAKMLGIPVAPEASGLIVQEAHPGGDLRWQGSRFMELVGQAQRGDFTDLICLDIDRFCRGGTAAYFEQEGYFVEAGITIHWVLDDVPADMPFRNTIVSARAEAAQWQRDKIKEASMRVRAANAERGDLVPSNKPPFGWQFVYDKNGRTNRRNQPMKVGLEPDPKTGKVLLHMYEHVAAGGSVGRLKLWIEEHGVPTHKGAAVWTVQVIRLILHNPTNWGERRSFTLKTVPRPNAARRAADVKNQFTRERVEGHKVDPSVLTPILGLTKDLAMRALAQMKQNGSQSPQPTEAPEEERCKRALLFRGMVRCGTCGQGMRIRPQDQKTSPDKRYRYVCFHNGTVFEGTPSMNISARKVDETVWYHACEAIRDPTYFERIVNRADVVAADAVVTMAKSRERLLDEKEKDLEILEKQIKRLNTDDTDDVELLDLRERAERKLLKVIDDQKQERKSATE